MPVVLVSGDLVAMLIMTVMIVLEEVVWWSEQ